MLQVMIRVKVYIVVTCVVLLTFSLFFTVSDAKASGGIVLQPPFDGTYRLTSYFDHNEPTYSSDPDGDVTIYTGETTDACDPYCYRGHNGIDWAINTGTDVLAAAAGTVEVAEYTTGYGCKIQIDHGDGYKTMYAHLDGWWVGSQMVCDFSVGEDDTVQAGTVLGDSGNTGASTGPHLHFTVEHNGYPTDPFGWRGSEQDSLIDYSGEAATCLWAGGPGDDISCADIIVEDGGAGWYEVGSWDESNAGNGYLQHSGAVWAQASASVQWTPPPHYPGYYQVYAFIPDLNSTTTNADYEIYTYPNTVHRFVNQNNPANVNFWASLGAHKLVGTDLVYLDDHTGEVQASRHIAADAMKFTASIHYLPDVRDYNSEISTIRVRNNTATTNNIQINYYNTSGGYVAYTTNSISSHGILNVTPPADFVGSAVVVASHDTSTVVATNYNNQGNRI